VTAALLIAGTSPAVGCAGTSPANPTPTPTPTPTAGIVLFGQKIPGVKVDLRLNGRLVIDDQPYSDVMVPLGLPEGDYHLSARMVGSSSKDRLRSRVTVQPGGSIVVLTGLDATGRPLLTVG
jgi:hypothetical protein